MNSTVNVQIKNFPGGPNNTTIPATTKVFLRPGSEARRGCRPLEPNEVVALDAKEADALLKALPSHLEMTRNAATRPLYYNSQYDAEITSACFNPATAGRADEAKEAMARIKQELIDGGDAPPYLQSDRDKDKDREIADLKAQLAALTGSSAHVDTTASSVNVMDDTQVLDDEYDYIPDANNATSKEKIEEEREQFRLEQEKAKNAETKVKKPPQRRRKAS